MKRAVVAFVLAFAVLAMISCTPAEQPAKEAETKTAPAPVPARQIPVDLDALSNRIVTQTAGIREGDIVIVNGGVRDMELLENIATDVRTVGAHPLITVGSDRMVKKYFEKVPEKYDVQSNALNLKIRAIATVDVYAGVPSSRLAVLNKAAESLSALSFKRSVRQINIGNGLYPTAWRASRLGMPQEEMAKTFWNAVNADYSQVQSIAEKVKAELSAGKELQIKNPNGTDLRVRIAGRPILKSDGFISPDDIKKGGPSVAVYLPAGEVFCAPLPGTAEGKVVISQSFYNGKAVNDLTMVFAKGKMTSLAGTGPGFENLKADYDAEGEGKDQFAFVDFGINPNLKIWPASKIGNWVQSGMVTVGIGGNDWAGGDNKMSYGYTDHIPGSTVTLDGRLIVENGVLKF
jgi:leucyl aminopeptidase (aminopeptidase T)